MGEDVSTAAQEALRTVMLDLATREVVEELRGRSIPSILLRGPAIARWLYPGEPRPYTDVDLLVPPECFDRAESALAELGFTGLSAQSSRFDRPTHDSIWIRDADGSRVELHRSLDGVGAGHADLWDAFDEETEDLDIGLGDFRVRALRPYVRALVVALHAAQHGGTMPWPEADLDRALERLPSDGWSAAAALAERIDAVPAFAVGLRMTKAGTELAHRLGLPEDRPVDVELRRAGAPAMSLAVDWLATLPGRRAKATFVLRELFPPVGYMRTRSALARRGAVGLAASYAVRPLWVAVRAPSAFFAWRRVRRERGTRASG